MILYTLKCIKDNNLAPDEAGGMLGKTAFAVKYEDRKEDQQSTKLERIGGYDEQLQASLGVSDEDVFYYFSSNEKLEVGGTFELDNQIWEKIA